MEDKHLQAMDLLLEILIATGMAAPLAIPIVYGISTLVGSLTKQGPTLTALADRMEQRLDANDTFGRDEIARLRAMVS